MTRYGHELRFGVFVTPSNRDAERVVALAVRAEERGLDLVTFQDHPYQPRFLDAWTLLSFVAARTSRVHLAPNVLNLRLRDPAVMARSVASLDILSGGRIELGLGAGAFPHAVAAMGGRRLTPGQAVDALDEAIDVIRAMWDVGQRAVRVEGEYHRLGGTAPGPAPVHDVELWVGGYRPRMLALIGRKADGWVPSLPYLEPGALDEANRRIDDAAHRAGRDPSAIRRLLNVGAEWPSTEWAPRLAALAIEHGVSTFILMADDAERIDWFASDVAPAVRELVPAS